MGNRRLFVGIPVSENLIEAFKKIKLRNNHLSGIRWVAERNLHLTTFFIGKSPADEVEQVSIKIEQIAKKFNRFELTFENIILAPPNSKPRMFWAKFIDCNQFQDLFKLLSDKLTQEEKKFKKPIPHITLARFRHLEHDAKLHFNIHMDSKIFCADKMVLWESILHESGAEYNALKSFELQ